MGAPGSTVELVVHGMLGGKQVAYPLKVKMPETASHPWAGRLWAKSRIDDVLEEMALHPQRAARAEERGHRAGPRLQPGHALHLVSGRAGIGADRGQQTVLASMREQRAKVVTANADAAALSRTADAARRSRPHREGAERRVAGDGLLPSFGLVKDLAWDGRQEKWDAALPRAGGYPGRRTTRRRW